MYVLCDNNGFIIDINDKFTKKLYYKLNDLKDQFIGILMNKLLSYLHKHFFIPKLNKISGIDKSKLMHKLNTKTVIRPFIIYNLHNEPIYVNVNIIEITSTELLILYPTLNMTQKISNINNNNLFILLKFELFDIPINNSIELFIENDKNNISTEFKESVNDIIVININILNANELLLHIGELQMIQLYKRLYADIITILQTYFYPFIYKYNNNYDNFTFILNADWLYSMKHISCIMAIYFCQIVSNKISNYIKIQIGISYGKLYYGLIDNKLKMIGTIPNLSLHLTKMCPLYEIVISYPFYQKLITEFMMINKELYDNSDFENCTESLIGFGVTTFMCIKPSLFKRFDNLFNK